MLKTVALVIAGLAAGFALAFWLAPGGPTPNEAVAGAATAPAMPGARDGGVSAARLASLENALAAETALRAELEQRVAELAAALDELRVAAPDGRERIAGGPADAETGSGEPPRVRARREPVSAQELQRRQVENLVAAGFPPDRAEWISRRTQELRMESLQAQYDATRDGRQPDPSAAYASERKLRTELGDGDYERYLTALNRPTSVDVLTVLASSPAERVGLKPGDQIVSYGGTRVFDTRELNALTFEGNAGESVVVEVRRDGQPLQLVLPRGPLGITGGFEGRRFTAVGQN